MSAATMKRYPRALDEIARSMDELDRLWQRTSHSESKEDVLRIIEEFEHFWAKVTQVIHLLHDDECLWAHGPQCARVAFVTVPKGQEVGQ